MICTPKLPKVLELWAWATTPGLIILFIYLFIYLSIYLFIKMGFHHVGEAGLELRPQVICPPQPPKVLGLQAWATGPGQILHFSSQYLQWPIFNYYNSSNCVVVSYYGSNLHFPKTNYLEHTLCVYYLYFLWWCLFRDAFDTVILKCFSI